jgi:hypothetical protein
MATLRGITVAFNTDLKQFDAGVDSVAKRLEGLKTTVDGLTKQFNDVSLKVKPTVDTSEIKQASKDVEDLEKEVEKSNPTVKVRVTGSLGGEFLASTSAQIKEYGESLAELGKATGTALKSAGSTVSAIGGVFDGTNASISGVITAVGRAEKAFQNWGIVLSGAAAATGVFVRYSGGLRTVLGALGGSTAATARLMASFTAATAAAGVGIAAYAGVMAVARVATAGLTEEARENVIRWTALGASAAAAAAGVYAANISFAAIYQSFRNSTTWAEFFTQALQRSSSSVASFAASSTRYMAGLVGVMTLARVASGEFRESLQRIGQEAEGIRNMADRFGATVEEMLVLEYAARSASVGMSQLARAQQAFYTNVSKVRIGQLGTQEAQEAKFAFDRLGVSIGELRDKSPQQVFRLVAGRLGEVGDAADRAAIAFDLFGRQAVNVLPALKGLKEAENDSRRLGTTLSGMNFKAFEDVDNAFDRAHEATANFIETTLASFAPFQASLQNAYADIVGGAASAFGGIQQLAAQPWQAAMSVVIEVTARVANILLRMIGILTKFAAAFTDAAAATPMYDAMKNGILSLLVPLERMLDIAEDVSRVFYTQLNPALEEGANAIQTIVYIAQTFATLAVMGGIFGALGVAFQVDFFDVIWRGFGMLRRINWMSAFSTLWTVMRTLLVTSISSAQNFIAAWLVARYTFVYNFVTPYVTSAAAVIAANTGLSVSAMATGVSMAAAFVIATAGLALIGIAIYAVYENFGKLYEYFSNFGDNVGRLITLEGLLEAVDAVTNAMRDAFFKVFLGIKDFFGNIIRGVILSVNKIKTPEKINAATTSVSGVIEARQSQQQATRQAAMIAASAAGMSGSDIPQITDDYKSLGQSLTGARDEMTSLSLSAARFGEAGRAAFLAARTDFDKLQQQLADNTIPVKVIVDESGISRSETALEAFDRRRQEIRASLNENLALADVVSPEQLQQSAEAMQKTVLDAFAKVRAEMRGDDLGSDLTTDRFFPTSDKVKAKAEEFAKNYRDELAAIEKKLQDGGFGEGQSSLRAKDQAIESAKQKFDRNMGKIEADKSFANDLRKSLEDAFLTPIQKYEKELKKIQDNESLAKQEKSLATILAQKQNIESVFGKTAGQNIADKEAEFAKASAKDQYGRTAFTSAMGSTAAGNARQSMEQTKLDVERRKAVGLDSTAEQKLKEGADNIADVFKMSGLSMADIQKELSPEQFTLFQQAMQKNTDAAKESLGIGVPAARKLAEGQQKLSEAVASNTISQEEAGSAARRLREDFLSSIGVAKTPFEEFSDAIDSIADQFEAAGQPLDQVRAGLVGNAEKLALFDRAVKQARDNLLSSLGIDKTPQQVFEEQMKKIDESVNSTDPSKRTTPEEATQARINAQRKRDESLGAGSEANNFASSIVEQRKKIEEAYTTKDSEGKTVVTDPTKFRMAMEKLGQSIPGADEQSPVQKFKDQLNQLEMLKGTIGEGDFNQRKKNLQAQLQEDMKPALDRLAPDRRQVDSADARSKAGVDTYFRILRGNDNPGLKAQLETAKYTKFLAEAAREPEAAPVIANLQGR